MRPEVGRKFGMLLDEFTQEVYEGFLTGNDQIVIGSIGPVDFFNEIIDERRTVFEKLVKVICLCPAFN